MQQQQAQTLALLQQAFMPAPASSPPSPPSHDAMSDAPAPGAAASLVNKRARADSAHTSPHFSLFTQHTELAKDLQQRISTATRSLRASLIRHDKLSSALSKLLQHQSNLTVPRSMQAKRMDLGKIDKEDKDEIEKTAQTYERANLALVIKVRKAELAAASSSIDSFVSLHATQLDVDLKQMRKDKQLITPAINDAHIIASFTSSLTLSHDTVRREHSALVLKRQKDTEEQAAKMNDAKEKVDNNIDKSIQTLIDQKLASALRRCNISSSSVSSSVSSSSPSSSSSHSKNSQRPSTHKKANDNNRRKSHSKQRNNNNNNNTGQPPRAHSRPRLSSSLPRSRPRSRARSHSAPAPDKRRHTRNKGDDHDNRTHGHRTNKRSANGRDNLPTPSKRK